MGTLQLFIGKGGVGKSTCSSLYSVKRSASGEKTLLDSMDPAHNLHDIFEQDLKEKEKKITSSLYVRETNMEKIRRSYIKSLKKDLAGIYHYQQALNIDKYFGILKFAPGMEEYSAWLALEACYQNTCYDHIVVDTPPTALTMKTLALSAVNLHWITQLEEMRREIIRKKNAVGRIRKENLAELGEDPVYLRLQKMKRRYEGMLAHLQNRERTEIVLVLNEDSLSFSESQQIKKDLAVLSIPIGRVIINKSSGQTVWYEKIAKEFPEAGIESFPLQDVSVTGLANLDKCSSMIKDWKSVSSPVWA